MRFNKPFDLPPDPTSYRTLRADPVKALRYPLALRFHDWLAGRRDGRVNLTGITEAPGFAGGAELTPETTVWLSHNTHREIERHRHEQLRHQAHTVRLQIRHDTVVADLSTAEQALIDAKAAYDAVAAADESKLTQRGAGETRTPDAVIRARRAREHNASVVAPAQQKVRTAEQRIESLTAELHQIEAKLDALAAVTDTRQARVTQLHARRGAVYRRAYLRALQRARLQPTSRTVAGVSHTETQPPKP